MPPARSSSSTLFRDKTRLQTALAELPTAPGIYRFYNAAGTLIYIGKSICLRDRVRSYFGKSATGKVRRMRTEIVNLDWEVTGSELEALLLESRLVKRHLPRFNVMLKEFIPLPCVRVDLRDPFPRLEVTRDPKRDGATYFGPFHSHSALETAIGGLSDALRLRTCEIDGARIQKQRPCYRHEFGTCSAPCLDMVTPEKYGEAVQNACAVFEGREEKALSILQARMERAAERLQFEIAARLRDAVKHIRSVCGRQHALRSAVDELSLVAVCPASRTDHLCLFVFRHGRMVFQEDAARMELLHSGARREWARRLLAAGAAVEGPPKMDSVLRDEIQIVTAWMRQRTRKGEFWLVPAAEQPAALVEPLSEWLLGQAGEELLTLAA
jgi:excinuclease UvrABC nuclease subunit